MTGRIIGKIDRDIHKYWLSWNEDGHPMRKKVYAYSEADAESTILPRYNPKAVAVKDRTIYFPGETVSKRDRIWIRDHGVCQLCGYYIWDEKQISLDHIRPKSRKGSNHIDNLQLAHKKCNSKKGSKMVSVPKGQEYPNYIIINPS